MSLVKMSFTIDIEAQKQRVWDVMLGEKTYGEWTSAFSPGSSFEGNWSEGSDIRFVGKDENGNRCGLYSRIVANRKFEFLGIEHLGSISSGVEERAGTSKWAGARSFLGEQRRDNRSHRARHGCRI
jgi:hypothetical protein